jgi:hypothetical protein
MISLCTGPIPARFLSHAKIAGHSTHLQSIKGRRHRGCRPALQFCEDGNMEIHLTSGGGAREDLARSWHLGARQSHGGRQPPTIPRWR